MKPIQINEAGSEEIITLFLKESKHPIVYKAKLDELIDSGLSDEEARDFISTTPFVMEMYYSPSNGLYLVESEAVDVVSIWNPYDGVQMLDVEE